MRSDIGCGCSWGSHYSWGSHKGYPYYLLSLVAFVALVGPACRIVGDVLADAVEVSIVADDVFVTTPTPQDVGFYGFVPMLCSPKARMFMAAF